MDAAQASEVARLRAQIEAEYRAAEHGMSGYAVSARHEAISARMNRIGEYHAELVEIVGAENAIEILAHITWLDEETGPQGDRPTRV